MLKNKLNFKRAAVLCVLSLATAPSINVRSASASTFINGGFESDSIGTYQPTGWNVGNADRNGAALSSLVPSSFIGQTDGGPGNPPGHRSAVVGPGLDPTLGSLLPNVVYSGNQSYRFEDSGVYGGYLSVVDQVVTNYTDSNIYFAWIAALENGGHTPEDSAGMIITLKDLTAGDTPISRIYNAGGGTDSRFNYNSSNGYYYTPQWQIENLPIDSSRLGHTFDLTVLATDCGPTAHSGYVYLDGFGAVTPPPEEVPEPLNVLGGLTALGTCVLFKRKLAKKA